mgnify:CR=1 FL=1
MSEYHIPVLTLELVELLEPGEGMVIVDATIGGGGQASAMLERMKGKGLLIFLAIFFLLILRWRRELRF